MFSHMDPEAAIYLVLVAVLAVMFIVAMLAWAGASLDADELDKRRRAAEKHATEESDRAEAAEAAIARLRDGTVTVDDHFDQTVFYPGGLVAQPAETLVMTTAGVTLSDPT